MNAAGVSDNQPTSRHRPFAGSVRLLALTALAMSLQVGLGAQPVPRATGPGSATARIASHPTWGELTPKQQVALQPLAGTWATLNETNKSKWLAVSRTYEKLPSTEQDKLHSRMSEWVALSPQQRLQARLNYVQAKNLTTEDKQAKWQAYQALSPEEKQKLATRAKNRAPTGAATAVRPITPPHLTPLPPVKAGPNPTPRIGVKAHQIDQHTLLPHHEEARQPAPAR